MGKSTTPAHRIVITDGNRTSKSIFAWSKKGRITDKGLFEYIKKYGKSFEIGGVNEHISHSLGYIPYPISAEVIHQKTGEVKAVWYAGMFQVW